MAARKVYQLAKELGIQSKKVLEYCTELRYDIANPLSVLTADQVAAVTARAKRGPEDGGSLVEID